MSVYDCIVAQSTLQLGALLDEHNIEDIISEDGTALENCVVYNFYEGAELCISLGAKTRPNVSSRQHLIWTAIFKKNHRMVRILLEVGAVVPSYSSKKSCWDFAFAHHTDPETLWLLIDHGFVPKTYAHDEYYAGITEFREKCRRYALIVCASRPQKVPMDKNVMKMVAKQIWSARKYDLRESHRHIEARRPKCK